jgi:glutamate-5-semialdehyde dehydrogenase
MTEKATEIAVAMTALGKGARAASVELATSSREQRDLALRSAAAALRASEKKILEANRSDLSAGRKSGLNAAMLDRLMLDPERIESMAGGLESIAGLPDPVGRILADWDRPNGLNIQRIAVPLGVIGIIYESRPNVTADAAALCLKSGNAVILRGGSDSYESSQAILECMKAGLEKAGINNEAIQMVPTRDRAAVGFLLSSMSSSVDVVVPRGGKSLIKRVQDEARVPVIGHLEGICHVYLHASADATVARDVVLNAKMRRTGICGAAETILVDAAVAEALLPDVCDSLINAGCEIRGDDGVVAIVPGAIEATEEDWTTEYLDSIVSIRIVENIGAAIQHIAVYGSGHTESIIASDSTAAEHFLRSVDSAIVLHNASTQFADGGEFGMGAEIGIATGRVHARGPVGAEQLTSYKYVVRGSGQVRP